MVERETVGFIGLGMMGLPMASRLCSAGLTVRGYDLSGAQAAAFAERGGEIASSPAAAARSAETLITMLPNSDIVEEALLGQGGAAGHLPKGAVVIDMSSSAPTRTMKLGVRLQELGVTLVDAPVSGGVARAEKGTLAIMAGGDPDAVERIRPILQAMGSRIFHTGPLGSGHAMKALNNYVSASGLVAACEALVVGKEFGLDAGTIVDVLNESTGRNNSTETKLKPFVLAESFSSGFSIGLMAKDIRTAAELASEIGASAPEIKAAAELWEEAAGKIGKGSDHTEIYRFLANRKMH